MLGLRPKIYFLFLLSCAQSELCFRVLNHIPLHLPLGRTADCRMAFELYVGSWGCTNTFLVLVQICYSDTSWYVELTGNIRVVYDT